MNSSNFLNSFRLRTLAKHLRAFRLSRNGNVAPMVAAAMIPMIGAVGLALDMGRAYMVRSQLADALDAAGLAAAQERDADEQRAVFNAFFQANVAGGITDVRLTGPNIVIADDGQELTLEASATLDTMLLSMIGRNELTVTARSVVQRQNRGMELVLVMDNTGSMAGSGKIGAMRDAALQLIDELYGDKNEQEHLWVGLVPFVTAVNIGNHRPDWLSPPAETCYRERRNGRNTRYCDAPPDGEEDDPLWEFQATNSQWKGCVEARWEDGRDLTDDPPGIERWHPYFYPTSPDNTWGPIDERNSRGGNATGPNVSCGPPVTPLTAAAQTVRDGIRAMQPWAGGGTMAHVGIAWGWRMLSPRWRGLWGADTPAQLPLDYDEDDMEKVIVILTDGDNNFFDSNRWDRTYASDYTAYDRVDEGNIGSSRRSTANNLLNSHTRDLCERMKANDIIVYTITFRVSRSSTRRLFEECATSSDHYFDSPSNAQLEQTFDEIGSQLSQLRLAQ